MHHPFETVLLVFGGLLVIGALLAGRAHRTFLSMTALFVVAGFLLGEGALGVLHFDAEGAFVKDVALLALIIILFRDGLEVEAESLRNHWHLPLRKLLIAMPVTCVLIALAAKLIIPDFSWLQAFLVGALLSPTDPILTSSIIQNPRVPKLYRSSLSLESGLNDGLALPAVLAFTAALGAAGAHGSGEHFVWWQYVIQDIGLGVVYGVVLGLIGAALVPSDENLPRHHKSLYGFGFAFMAYGAAHLGPRGNGLIAVFICAIVLGIKRDDIRIAVEDQSEDVVEMIKLGIFVVFGALLTIGSLFTAGVLPTILFAAACFLVARPVAILVALAGSKQIDLPGKLFLGWFGPRGVGTMTFGLLVLTSGVPGAEKMFYVASAVVFFSIMLHGSTDNYGAKWISRRSGDSETEDPDDGSAESQGLHVEGTDLPASTQAQARHFGKPSQATLEAHRASHRDQPIDEMERRTTGDVARAVDADIL